MYVHILCMSCSAFLMAIAPIMMISINGPSIILQSWNHTIWGFVLYCTLPFLLLSGSVCKISKDNTQVTPPIVYFRNKAHSIFGWVYIILLQVSLSTGWYGTNSITNVIFGIVLISDIISYSLYLYLKFFKNRIQTVSINKKFI